MQKQETSFVLPPEGFVRYGVVITESGRTKQKKQRNGNVFVPIMPIPADGVKNQGADAVSAPTVRLVPRLVAGEFGSPVVPIVRWHGGAFAAWMAYAKSTHG